VPKRVLIIGAGVAGLSAGCYARMNGYDTQILESHTLPGGLCTSWKRKGYTIDGSCHWVTGSGPANGYYRVWQELGALKDRVFIEYDYFARFRGDDGRVFNLYTDPQRLERHMKELSPADAKPIEEFCGLASLFRSFSMPVGRPAELMTALDGIRIMMQMRPFMKVFKGGAAYQTSTFAARFKDPLLRDGIIYAMYGASDSLFPLIMTLGTMGAKAAGYPLGGSLEFARAIERRYTGLGGRVSYNMRVQKVLEKDGHATGVRCADGTTAEADVVISACDMRQTLFSFLDGSRVDPVHRELLESGKLIDPAVQVSFGVDMDLSGAELGFSEAFHLRDPICIGGRKIEWYNAKHYCFDPSMAPRGKSVVTSIFLTDWRYWETMARNPAAYTAEKERIAADCLRSLEVRYPGISAKVEMSDVVTPLTYVRYTGNWKGVYMTWVLDGAFRRKHRYIPKTVPGLDGFYLASMWTDAPGGLPGAAAAGRGVIQLLCKANGKRFVTTEV
jgi:phytoene dehydrogenase-like protein